MTNNEQGKLSETEKKENEAQRLNQIILDSVPMLISVRDSKGKIVQVSQHALELFEVADMQEYVANWHRLSPINQPCGTPTMEKLADYDAEALRNGKVQFDWMCQTKSGKPLPMKVTEVKFDHMGEELLVVYALDMREIMTAQTKEREAQNFNQIILDSAPLVMSVRSSDNKIIHVSQQALDLFGVANIEEYKENWSKLSPEYQPCGTLTSEKAAFLITEAFSKGNISFEWMYQTKNGEPLPMNVNVVKFENMGEEMLLVYAFDLRPIKKAMEKEQEAKLAVQESKQKSRFLAQISHEIRTPMNAILGITEIQLQKEALPKDFKDSLSHIRNSSYLLLSIINNLLDVSKAEAGKMEIVSKPYETISLVVDTAQLNMFYMGSKRIEFRIHVDKNLPTVLIGDELRIKQVLNNMLSNAFKYTNEGLVTLSMDSIQDESESSDDITLRIQVKDTGRGMSPLQVRQLFGEEFLRFDENDTIEGSGLGMVITHQLINLMGGKIDIDSELGKGTSITLYIPQKAAGDEIIGEDFSQKLQNFEFMQMAKHQVADFVREPMPYGRVLVVDDVELNLYVAKGHLSPYELDVDTAMSGFETIDKINTGEKYDIVFMDHMMPSMDGVEAVKKLREGGYKGVIVALTANALVGNVEAFLRQGFDDFISKPIDIRDLDKILTKFIKRRHPEESAKYNAAAKVVAAAMSMPDKAESDEALSPKMREMFRKDAKRAISKLRQTNIYSDLKLLSSAAHAIRPMLAYVGENELSEDAKKLEQAGKSGDMAYIDLNLAKFVESLEALLDKFQLPQTKSNEDAVIFEDMEYLAGELKKVEAACLKYDVKSAVAAIEGLLEKAWKKETADTLMKMRDIIFLDSDFEKTLEILKSDFPFTGTKK